MVPPQLPTDPPAPVPPPKFHWLLFLGVIFVPTIITIIAGQLGMKDLAPASAGLGGGLSGIVAGILLGRRLGRTDAARVGLSLAFVVVLSIACVTMNCFGCLASGFKMDF